MVRPLLALFCLLLAGYLAVVGAQSWYSPRLSPDSLNYLMVARELSAGRGLQQPTLGFNQPTFAPDARIPTPYTAQAPGYPLAIAALAAFGPSHEQAASLIALLGWVALLVAAFFCARELGGTEAGWLAVTFLLLQPPVRRLATFAWSETLACALLLGGVWLLLRRGALAGGLLVGLACATRYALLPIALLAGGCLFIQTRASGRRRREVVAYALGASLPIALVLGRNRLTSGSFLPPANPSDQGFEENLWQAGQALVECLFGGVFGTNWEIGLLALVALGACVAAARRPAGIRDALTAGRWSLWMWPLGYFTFLVWQRTWTHFDELGHRLVAPTAIGLSIPLALLGRHCWPRVGRWALPSACAVLAVCLAAEASRWSSAPQPERRVPRLALVRSHLGPRDLLLGDDLVGLAYALRLPAAVNFSRYPYSDRPTYESIQALQRGQAGRFERIFLVLGRDRKTPELWEFAFGRFFADLAGGQDAKYPGVRRQAEDDEGWLFVLEPSSPNP